MFENGFEVIDVTNLMWRRCRVYNLFLSDLREPFGRNYAAIKRLIQSDATVIENFPADSVALVALVKNEFGANRTIYQLHCEIVSLLGSPRYFIWQDCQIFICLADEKELSLIKLLFGNREVIEL
jgi:hypothetical protein